MIQIIKKNYRLILIVIAFIAVFTLAMFFINSYHINNTGYVLKSYKNTVALYNGEKIVKVYNDIVLNTLPQNDIQNFNKGISFETQEYAEKHLEDFDG